MFGLFKSQPYRDDQLGEFKRSWQHWRGSIVLPSQQPVELHLSGDKKQPDAACLALARELPGKYDSLKPGIQAALFEHFEPYGQAVRDGEFPQNAVLVSKITRAEDVWSHVTLERILVEPMLDTPTVELAYAVAWDEEHTLGARFQQWNLVELCGSVA